jgi:hypothetical protein
MPELIHVPLAELEMGDEYSVIFPIGDIHEAYDTVFVQGDTRDYLFEIMRVIAGHKSVGDRFSVRVGEQTLDITNRIGYLILKEQAIHFPDDLADAHVDNSTDAEVGAIFAQQDNERTRLLNSLLMRSPSRSPIRVSPFSRSHTPINGGGRRRRRTRRRPARKRPSRRRTAATRRRRKRGRMRR